MIINGYNIDFDKEKTNSFYVNYDQICNCTYCRNFYAAISNSYPQLKVFLEKFGLDIENPIEAMEYCLMDNNKRSYSSVYAVSGVISVEFSMKIGEGLVVDITESDRFYNTGMEAPYFLIKVHNIELNWVLKGPAEN